MFDKPLVLGASWTKEEAGTGSLDDGTFSDLLQCLVRSLHISWRQNPATVWASHVNQTYTESLPINKVVLGLAYWML